MYLALDFFQKLKSSQPDQEVNELLLSNILTIPHFHSVIQHSWHIVSLVSLKPFFKKSVKIKRKKNHSPLGLAQNF